MNSIMEGADKKHLKWFGLALAGTWVFAMLLPVGQWTCLATATLITGIIMLAFAGFGLLGYPMKGGVDPLDVASGAVGILLGTVLIYFFSR